MDLCAAWAKNHGLRGWKKKVSGSPNEKCGGWAVVDGVSVQVSRGQVIPGKGNVQVSGFQNRQEEFTPAFVFLTS